MTPCIEQIDGDHVVEEYTVDYQEKKIVNSDLRYHQILILTSGVSVERRSLPAGTFVDATDAAKGSKHACVRSSGDHML